ncbi:MAG: FAD-binding monooxygenase [Caldilineaceae bacterium]|nr:FAD-binding monooxygenase [Caldilineaceae bacterium]
MPSTQKDQSSRRLGRRAVVIGASMAGLLAARVLSNHFDQVFLLERDKVHDHPETRKGQPHTRHVHGLLARGFEIMTHYFPGLPEDLVQGGALIGDMGADLRWFVAGGYRLQTHVGMNGVLSSRPFLEWRIRRMLLTRPNITLLDECEVKEPATDSAKQRITGVHVVHRGDGHRAELLETDLVIDASGRGSAAAKWLAALGYAQPEEEAVQVNIGYASRIYRRKPGDLVGANLIMITPTPPQSIRGGFAFPMEDDRWIVGLGGRGGDYPPTDEAGFLEFARSLAAPDIYNLLLQVEPLSEIVPYRFPANLRRRYEKLARFPEGFLVLGDAVCSFNPVYGQGMTSAALQAVELDRLLADRGVKGLASAYFKQIVKIIDIPWQIAVGEDFRFPTTQGKKAPETDLINAYVTQVNRASHHDPVALKAFLEVMNLIKPPSSLMRPRILWRVLRRSRKTLPAPQPQPAAAAS